MFRKIFGGIAVVGGLMAMLAVGGYADSTYTLNAKVISVSNNTVAFVDTEGDVWEAENCGDFSIGESVKLTMFSNHTNTIFDDEIVNVRKSR